MLVSCPLDKKQWKWLFFLVPKMAAQQDRFSSSFHINDSGKGLGFLNPMSQLRRWDDMSFCVHLENSGDR